MTRWLSVTLSPDVPVVSTVGTSSLKSPTSVWRGIVFVVLVVGLMALGNVALANTTIKGKVFHDFNTNGTHDEDEPFLSNIDVVYSYVKGGGLTTETTTTDLNGDYIFENVIPGLYGIALTPDGRYPTYPETGFHIGTIISDETININLGQAFNSIDGSIYYEDNNGDKVGVGSGWLVKLDYDVHTHEIEFPDGTAIGSFFEFTDSNGNYSFEDLDFYGTYTSSIEQPPTGWEIIGSEKHVIELTSGYETNIDKDFRVKKCPMVTFNLPIVPICDNGLPIPLTDGSPTGGVYSGKGVTNSNFYPEIAGSGEHNITYTVTENGCTKAIISKIEVKAAPSIADFFYSKKIGDTTTTKVISSPVVTFEFPYTLPNELELLDGSKTSSFSWYEPDYEPDLVAVPLLSPAKADAAGVYWVEYTDDVSKCTVKANFEVQQGTVDSGFDSEMYCLDGSPSGSTYSWKITEKDKYPALKMCKKATGVASGLGLAGLTDAFVKSINNKDSVNSSEVCTGNLLTPFASSYIDDEACFLIPDTHDLYVGAKGTEPSCLISNDNWCAYNPTIKKVALKCALPPRAILASLTTGNGATSFDGSTPIEIPHNQNLVLGVNDFSISTWIKTSDSNAYILSKEYNQRRVDNVQGYALYLSRGDLSLRLADGNGSWKCSTSASASCTNYNSGKSIPDGEWHLVVVTVDRDDPNGGKFYVDGTEVSTFDPTPRIGSLDTAFPLKLGSNSSSTSGMLNGELDEVTLYRRALTKEDVYRLYKNDSNGICKVVKSEAPTTFDLTVNNTGSGTVSGGGSFAAGTTVNLTATQETGSTFDDWTPAPCASRFAMPANDLTCTATFTTEPNPTIVLLKPTSIPSKICKDESFDITFGVETTSTIDKMYAWLPFDINILQGNTATSHVTGGSASAIFASLGNMTFTAPTDTLDIPVGTTDLFTFNFTPLAVGTTTLAFREDLTWSKRVDIDPDIGMGIDTLLTQTNQSLQLNIEDCGGSSPGIAPSGYNGIWWWKPIILKATAGLIKPNQVLPHAFSMPKAFKGSTLFKVNWPGSDLDLAITTPSGETLTRDSSEVLEVYEGDTEEYWLVESQETGDWQVNVVAVEVDAEGEPYGLSIIANERSEAPTEDTDNDGLPDEWETYFLGDLTQDGNADSDGDGVSNLREFQEGINPTSGDTDGDGKPDVQEIANYRASGILKD
ncbi:MAG: LamG-like jellyroll fold domain-containing protein, partial [Candidatus Parabeggiatoa sp.]|nr:LamG-like jellyroll fold domain-containing protein [Candidatus Parabeggiatoa sp.]